MNKVIYGDCLEVLPTLDDNSVDAIVTDPPYELGFMNKGWDASGIAYNVDLWRECLRVLKPGGHLLSFGGSRTYHRMACAIEDAGFEIRDQIQWLYGSGFPKSQAIGKAIDKAAGVEREVTGTDKSGSKRNCMVGDFTGGEYNLTKGNSKWEGWGSALKPAHEPIVLARKPLSEKTIAANVLKWGTGGINIDGCRVKTEDDCKRKPSELKPGAIGYLRDDKPMFGGNGSDLGRFPANLILDGSDEVVQGFPQTTSKPHNHNHKQDTLIYGNGKGLGIREEMSMYDDSGSAARFFYCAKASKAERNMGCDNLPLGEPPASARSKPAEGRTNALGEPRPNNHPTVKPLALMRYLCRLITPPDGTVLDPFAGSGSTLIAAKQEGFSYIGIEMEEEYIEIIKARLSAGEDNQLTITL
jgi:DNA modification methylase